MSTATHTHKPRCSFCGSKMTSDLQMVRGSDAYICQRCARQAADMMRDASTAVGSADAETTEPESADPWKRTPSQKDINAAYAQLRITGAPLRDLIEGEHEENTMYAFATLVSIYRHMNSTRPLSASLRTAVRRSLRHHHRHN